MARAVDANELEMFPYTEGAGTEDQIADWIEQVGLSGDDTASRARNLCWKVIGGFINVVKTQPTLTPPNEWVSVEERLPEEKQRVIVRCEHIGTSVGWILWGNWMTDIGPDAGNVTHWMPLPAPPDRHPPEGEEDT